MNRLIVTKKYFVGLLFFLLSTYGFAEEFKVIVNKKAKVTKLSRAELRQIFSVNKTTWENGNRIVLGSLVFDSKLGSLFVEKVLGKNSEQVMKFYLQKVFSGALSEVPVETEDFEEMIEFVSSRPGAIGYVPTNTKISDEHIVEVKIE